MFSFLTSLYLLDFYSYYITFFLNLMPLGLWLQGLSLDTQVLLEDMQQLGAKLEISTEVI